MTDQESTSRLNMLLPTATWMDILGWLAHPSLEKDDQMRGWEHIHDTVRFVSKDLYLVSMHLLRSRYLDSYERLVRPPYTSDPYPVTSFSTDLSASSSSSQAPPAYSASSLPSTATSTAHISSQSMLATRSRREAHTLDLYVAAALKRELEDAESDMMIADTSMQDIFTILQPQSRLEDLVMDYGVRAKVLRRDALQTLDSRLAHLPTDEKRSRASASSELSEHADLVRPSSIQCTFTPRKATLRLPLAFGSLPPDSSFAAPRIARRNVIEVERSVQESLEDTAKALLRGLRRLHCKRHAKAGVEWYEIIAS
ncbi:hypothetical protein IE81DRAFT_321417 [Ceraceosorus guamensis]|uniref:Uncharacterized protein n=1 Tax=Ceraceosorus guamensis TaxID=1522189 RepID=A0A316W5A1_9BASI|nr:hypothetical protein IE81DRAFT_321417 [Ceraceosorus guamensis]PWN44268.1 hypothetical protein IE81DRAFT_321417 [Ceraceosorus guamensis]